MEQPRTREMADVFRALEVEGNVLLVLPEVEENIFKSVRNLPGALALAVDELNTYDILSSEWVVFTRRALEKLQGGGEDEGSA